MCVPTFRISNVLPGYCHQRDGEMVLGTLVADGRRKEDTLAAGGGDRERRLVRRACGRRKHPVPEWRSPVKTGLSWDTPTGQNHLTTNRVTLSQIQ